VDKRLGRGGFGTVVRAKRLSDNTKVAIKLLHRDEFLHSDITREEEVYRLIASKKPDNFDLFVNVLDTGDHRGFHCIVLDLCFTTLHDLMASNIGFMPLSDRHYAEIAYQVLIAIEYLHSLKVIHADVKPDNILIRSGESAVIERRDIAGNIHTKRILLSTRVCLADLGNSVDNRVQGNYGRVGIRPYRAPEITLGLPWSFPIDIFAAGVVLVELRLSLHVLSYDIASDWEHLAALSTFLGPFAEDHALEIERQRLGTF
ncbi:kinase-like domain-containing protein, partial [Trametes polyzona]